MGLTYFPQGSHLVLNNGNFTPQGSSYIANAGSIGGIPIGTQGAAGTIYFGYTLVGGDDFTSPLDIMHIGNPYGRYNPTRMAGTTTPSMGTRLDGAGNGYYMDPYHTGAQDSNRGVPIGSTNLSQANSLLMLQSRIPITSAETNGIDSRAVLDAAIYCGSDTTYTPPCIYEHYSHYKSSGYPAGLHATGWSEQVWPFAMGSGAPGWQEYDFPEAGTGANYNAWGTVTGPGSTFGSFSAGADGFHLFSLVMTASNVKYYYDQALQTTVAQDATNSNKPSQPIFSSATDSSFNLTPWTALGATGTTSYIDYYRIWLPNAQASKVLTPTQKLPNMQVAFNTAFTYTFPATAALWNLSVTDYIQGGMLEDYEPGGGNTGVTSYYNFPSELTLTGRVLTGSITSRPGRIHTMAIPYLAGGSMGRTARGYIDVGPRILTASLSGTIGTPFSYDVYANCDCGDLLPKTLSVTGLQQGLSFSATTGLITGTPTGSADSFSVTINVANCNATIAGGGNQTATKTVTCTLASTGVVALDTAVTSSNFVVGTQTTTVVIGTTNAGETLCFYSKMNSTIPANGITSVMDTTGLTWILSGSITNTVSRIEHWTAIAPTAITTTTITVISGTGTTSNSLIAYSVSNSNQTTAIDPNASSVVGAFSNTSVTSLTTTISTNHANDFVTSCIANAISQTYTVPTGFTEIVALGSAFRDASYQVQSSTLTSHAIVYHMTPGSNCLMLTVAVQGV